MAITATVKMQFGVDANLYIDWFGVSGDKSNGFRADFHGYSSKEIAGASGPGNDAACMWSCLVTFEHDPEKPVLDQAFSALLERLRVDGVSDAAYV
jgi:hypothetical protein